MLVCDFTHENTKKKNQIFEFLFDVYTLFTHIYKHINTLYYKFSFCTYDTGVDIVSNLMQTACKNKGSRGSALKWRGSALVYFYFTTWSNKHSTFHKLIIAEFNLCYMVSTWSTLILFDVE